MYGSLVLPTKVEGLDVRAEVIDVPTGESEGFVRPEDCSVIHLLGSVLLDQRTSFAQHGSIVKARGDSELDGMEQITLIIAFPRYMYVDSNIYAFTAHVHIGCLPAVRGCALIRTNNFGAKFEPLQLAPLPSLLQLLGSSPFGAAAMANLVRINCIR